LKIPQVVTYVEGKSVRRNVVADVYAYGANFLFTHPDTGVFRYPVTLDTESQQQVDYGCLQFPDIFAHAKTVFFEVKDGIAYKLSRTVTGNTSAPIGMKNGYSLSSQCLRRHNYVLSSPEPSYGEDRPVLQEQ